MSWPRLLRLRAGKTWLLFGPPNVPRSISVYLGYLTASLSPALTCTDMTLHSAAIRPRSVLRSRLVFMVFWCGAVCLHLFSPERLRKVSGNFPVGSFPAERSLPYRHPERSEGPHN